MPARKSTTKSSRGGSSKRSNAKGLVVIGVYKLIEAALMIVVGFGVLHLLHRNLETVAVHWVHVLGIDPENRYIHRLLAKTFSVSPRQLKELSAGTFIYAGLRIAEGIGLVRRERWGEYLTAGATAIFIPLEIFEMFRHFSAVKVIVFAVNVAILVYLIAGLRRHRR